MKKIFTLLCVALCATSLFANVVTGTCGDNLQWAYDTDTHALTITGSGDMYWSGGRPWEQVAGEITSVSLPDGLTSIGNSAFSNCSSLTSITIPNSVTTVGGGMFYGCSKLKSVVLSNNITSLPSYSDLVDTYGFFENCSALTSITIPNSVTSIGYEAFYECSSLTSVTIPNSVTSIESSAFERCYNLTSVTIGNSVTSIGDDAFYDCSSLSSVTIPNSVTSIGYHAFYNCRSLTSITIPNSVTSIGSSAFASCTSLTSVTIPNSVTSIGKYAFSSCSQVTMQGTTPPTITANTFSNNATIFVPCSAMDAYLAAPAWQFLNLNGLKYNVNLTATEGGSAKITAADCESNSVTIEANPTDCNRFKQWSDGNTDNPRTLTLTRDITLTAEFEAPKYYTVKIYGESLSGSYEREEFGCSTYWDSFYGSVELTMREGTSITFSDAYVGECGNWTGWSDGVTERERTIVITSDTTIYSIIEYPELYTVNISGDRICGYYSGYCGGSHWEEYYGTSSVQLFVNEGTSISVREEGSCGTWLGWSDGVTEKERTIFINSDTTISSRFDVATYSVSITAGEGGYLENGNIELEFNECNRDWIYTCAYAYEGYYFAGWSDGNTSQCINIYPDTDINLVAQFAPKEQVTALVGVDNACKGMGVVTGGGIYYSGDVITISATPNAGYHFVEWSDGNSGATRDLYLQSDTTLFATFAPGEYGGKCGENLYWTYGDNTITITGSGDMDLDTYPAWNNYYDDWYDNVTAVQFPKGITSIDDYAFSGMSLTNVVVPSSVTHFGEAAFASNYNLTRFEYLGTEAECAGYENYDPILYSCYNLRYFKGQVNMLSYDNDYLDTVIITSGEAFDAFYGSVSYVDNSKSDDKVIGNEYAEFVKSIKTLYLPIGLQEIGDFALMNARYLSEITIPTGVTRIGESAFEDCRLLDSVTFAGTALREIDDWAFYNCHSLKNITIPEGVTEIGEAAFYGCTYLTEITLPSSVQEIADNGFARCAKIQKMHVKATTPPTIQAKTFFEVNRQIPVYVPDGSVDAYKDDQYWQEFYILPESSGLEEIVNNNQTKTLKLLYNGQLIIVRDGKTYTIMGAEIQ